MSQYVSSVRAVIPAPRPQVRSYEVRDQAGELIARINRDQAAELIDRGWANAVGSRMPRTAPGSKQLDSDQWTRVKYLRLRSDAPWNPYRKTWTGGNYTTRTIRADQTCHTFAPGQPMGDPKSLREHKPTNEA
jgi:hypothetical protein